MITRACPPLDSIPDDELRLYTAPGEDGEGQRVATRRVKIGDADPPYLIVVSQPLETVTEELAMLRRVFLIAVPLALLLAGLGGFFLARKSLAPVVAMSERARQISAENLERRLPVANPRDELGQLASTFNELLARLDASFDLQRQFMADASHELRTPLSVMRTATQVILEKPRRDENEYRDALAMINDQTRRLSRIVDDMFTLARADAGRRPLAHERLLPGRVDRRDVARRERVGRAQKRDGRGRGVAGSCRITAMSICCGRCS